MGFGAQDADRTTPYFQETRRHIQLAKDTCYPIIAGHPLVYHHTPDIGVSAPGALVRARVRGRGPQPWLCGGVLTGEQPRVQYVLRPRGVDRARDYAVTLDNTRETMVLSGRELADTGLTCVWTEAISRNWCSIRRERERPR